ncbi:hypothetical protein [Flavisolibacter nicotianae]|uniref:hypothetical protein n=1 Tax=Flavisolibacter nicotianae TaxID=2364882 RepID=UPI0013C43183|nr:hypothetical protein [Flavisolibacter nicotianae]
MKEVVLYFPDAVNLRAFLIVEGLGTLLHFPAKQVLRGKLTRKQLAKAFTRYGAVLKQV